MSKYLSKEAMELALKRLGFQKDAAEKPKEVRRPQVPAHEPEKDKEESKCLVELEESGKGETISTKPISQGHWYFDRDMAPEIAAETARQKRILSRRDGRGDAGGLRDAKAVMIDTLDRLGREGSKGEKDKAFGDFAKDEVHHGSQF